MAESFDEEDYESLPATTTLTTHLMAGAAAGVMEHAIMYPVDSVKVITVITFFVSKCFVSLMCIIWYCIVISAHTMTTFFECRIWCCLTC